MGAKASVAWLSVCFAIGVVPARAEEVSLSRYVVTLTSDSAFVPIDLSVVGRFCGDAEGCEIVVRLERANEFRAMAARLFLAAGATGGWFSTETNGVSFADGDDLAASRVLRLDAGPAACVVDDGDPDFGGFDAVAGFEASVSGGPENFATCTITISD